MAKSQIEIDSLTPDDDDSDGGKKKSSRRTSSRASAGTSDTELRTRLVNTFMRISEALEARGDEELAAILEDDAKVMAQGLVSATKPFKLARLIVLTFVSLVEPVLAFGRVFRVLFSRFIGWRSERQSEYEQARQEAELAVS